MEMCGEAHKNMEPKVIDGVDFLPPPRGENNLLEVLESQF